MKNEQDLRRFLMVRFILVLVIVSSVEYAVLSFVNRFIMPFILKVYFPGFDRADNYGYFMLILFFLSIILVMIASALSMIIPEAARNGIDILNGVLSKWLGKTVIETGGDNIIEKLNMFEEVSLFIIAIFVIFIVVVPIAFAAFYYSRITIKEFDLIAKEREEREKTYYRKRNLMLSDIAHDLRTPITTVAGYSKALSDGMVKEEDRQEYLDAIMRKSVRMNDLINLLFDYVKIDSEGFKLNRNKENICEVVRECGALQYSDVEDAGMELDADIPEEECMISLDRLQFSRVVTNLLTNAIKHNDKGTKIGLYVKDNHDRVIVTVADTGDAIEEEKAESIFEPFYMGDESRNSKGGSGLGLSVVKKIVDMHGFRIILCQGRDLQRYNLESEYTKAFIILINKED